jgi:hypothetical protein
MDAKFSRLQNFINESNNNNNNNDNGQSWSRAIFSRDVFQTNMDRVQSFFNKRTDTTSSSGTDDMQMLLQKGDNDPILPALVRFYTCHSCMYHGTFRVVNNVLWVLCYVLLWVYFVCHWLHCIFQ